MMTTYNITLTSESFGIGEWYPGLKSDEVFIGVVPVFVFDLIGWKTKRQSRVENGEGAVFIKRQEMINTARVEGGPVRRTLLKTLLKIERAKREKHDMMTAMVQ